MARKNWETGGGGGGGDWRIGEKEAEEGEKSLRIKMGRGGGKDLLPGRRQT